MLDAFHDCRGNFTFINVTGSIIPENLKQPSNCDEQLSFSIFNSTFNQFQATASAKIRGSGNVVEYLIGNLDMDLSKVTDSKINILSNMTINKKPQKWSKLDIFHFKNSTIFGELIIDQANLIQLVSNSISIWPRIKISAYSFCDDSLFYLDASVQNIIFRK